jgi:CheY-like chemotaxis protein
VADSVAAALRLSGSGFDVVISDIGLPDGSGLDLMRELRALRTVKGIALSGYGSDRDVRSSLDAGFAAHLTKPIDLAQLIEAIARVSGSPEATRDG